MSSVLDFCRQLDAVGSIGNSVANTESETAAPHRTVSTRPQNFCPTTIPVGNIRNSTGPLELLHGRRVLALFDFENLSISARELGYWLDFRSVYTALSQHATDLDAHVIFSRESGRNGLINALSRYGYKSHARDVVYLSGGSNQCLANSDSRILFEAGRLTADHQADTLLIGTGDGDLGDEIAQAIRLNFGERWTVVTLSLAGSTSHRLSAGTNRAIHANLAIGHDVLNPLPKVNPQGKEYRR